MKKNILGFISIFFIISNTYAYKIGDKVSEDFFLKNNINSSKTIIVDFFASWCVSCEKELPLINNLFINNKDKNIVILGIDTDEDKKDAIKFQKKLDIKFKVINDTTQKLVEEFSPIGMPALYYIEDKIIKKIIFGAVPNIDKKIINDLKNL
ncbi:MAG: TlpA family protein disulfide reductase [Campylobacterales bacterium]|nr:TlpA family protein disulfide reductase [Campylobacterales bacterium]